MRSIQLTLVFFLASGWCVAQMSPQTKKVTEKFFPDPEMEINTPAFAKKKGFTNYDEMMGFIQERIKLHPEWATVSFIGTSQKGMYIPMVRLNKPNGNDKKLKVWMQGGLHGNEPASTEGLLYLLDQLLTNDSYASLLDELEIAIVPMANVDGCQKVDRYAANGLDLNRDQTKLMAPESVVLKQAFSDFAADVAVDFHEYRPYRKDFAQLSSFGVTSPYDAMFLYSSNLNVPQSLRFYTRERFVANAMLVMDANQLTHRDYFSTQKDHGAIKFNQGSLHSRSSATSYALSNTVSSLIEVRGVGIGRTSYLRRVNTTFLVAKAYLTTAHDHADEVREELAKAEASTHDAVTKMKRPEEDAEIELLDIETNELITIKVVLRDAQKTEAVNARQRPAAYLILPGNEALVTRLNVLGVKTRPLEAARELEAERYTVTAYERDGEKYEGVYQQEVTASCESVSKNFPAGTIIVDMNQPRANLAIEVLEPEAANSFVSFSVLETELGAELPIYRYLQKDAL